jgi:hypothetical protein
MSGAILLMEMLGERSEVALQVTATLAASPRPETAVALQGGGSAGGAGSAPLGRPSLLATPLVDPPLDVGAAVPENPKG